MPTSTHRFSVNVNWLIKLRWVAVIGQMLTIAGAMIGVGIQLTLWPLGIVIGLTAVSNLLLMFWFSSFSTEQYSAATWNLILGLVMTMDMLSLTTLLYSTGGPTNPFWLFFFVNLSLSAVVLDRNWAWCLNLLSIVCFGWLLFYYIQVPELDLGTGLFPIGEQNSPGMLNFGLPLTLTQTGMLVAFATCSSVIVYFMTRLTGELRQQETDLRLAQQHQARSEKLEALGTLAAGAAHELSTPLTTIALVTKDVEQAIKQQDSGATLDASVVEDVGLIRGQLDRCKKILDRMASHAGETVGEMMQNVTVRTLCEEITEGLDHPEFVNIQYQGESADVMLNVPLDALSQAIRGLVQNAIDASSGGETVQVAVSSQKLTTTWLIEDRGSGIPPEVLKRVSEPFFTTKQPGKGMGLGVFLAKNVVQRLGGTIEFESKLDVGTMVRVIIPIVVELEDAQTIDFTAKKM